MLFSGDFSRHKHGTHLLVAACGLQERAGHDLEGLKGSKKMGAVLHRFPKNNRAEGASAVEERLTASCRRMFLCFIQSKIALKLLQVTVL